LALVAAVLTACWALAGPAYSLLGSLFLGLSKGGSRDGPGHAELFFQQIEPQAPGYLAVQVGFVAVTLFLGLVLFGSAFGLLWSASWSRWTTAFWCLLTLLVQAGYFVYQVGAAIPPVDEIRMGSEVTALPAGVLGWTAHSQLLTTAFNF